MDLSSAAVTLGAVIVGGLLSLAGSIWVQRRELRRSERVVQYRDLVPAMLDITDESLNDSFESGVAPDTDNLIRSVGEVLRRATIAGDCGAVQAIERAAENVRHANPYAGLTTRTGAPASQEQRDALAALREALGDYLVFLRERLG